ncbi:MAG: ChbG/HpnK family deacetylase [Candidatus Moraniibacteriota bacterium]
MPRPKLIITADDYGMSPRFNQGMLEAARSGLVTGISVMIKRKYIRKAELLTLGISLGLHLELENSSSYREIISQIERFKKCFGRLPVYLDGHQHKHVTLGNIDRVIRAAQRYGLPIRSRLPTDRAHLLQNGIATPSRFVSWHPERLSVLEERLLAPRSLPVSELVVHPGYFDKRCRYTYNQEREAELAFLKSEDFRKLIRPFQLIRYTDITDSARDVRTTAPEKSKKRVRHQIVGS